MPQTKLPTLYFTLSTQNRTVFRVCSVCRVFVLDFIKHWYFLLFCVRRLWHLYRNISKMLQSTIPCCGCKFFCKPKGVSLGSTPVKMKTVIKWVMYHCTHDHSDYRHCKGFHYSCFEAGCFNSACENSLALILGFSNDWSICHDMTWLWRFSSVLQHLVPQESQRPSLSWLFAHILGPLRDSEQFATVVR